MNINRIVKEQISLSKEEQMAINIIKNINCEGITCNFCPLIIHAYNSNICIREIVRDFDINQTCIRSVSHD